MSILNLRRYVRVWSATSSVMHGVQRILPHGMRLPYPVDSEMVPFTVFPRDQEDNKQTHLNKLHTIALLQGISPEGFTVDLRSTQSGDLQTAATHLSFQLRGATPGPTYGYKPRHAEGQKPLEYIAPDSKNNMYVPDNIFITDDEGWIDVRQFSRFSLTASATGELTSQYEEGSSPATNIDLDFDGEIKVEYRNYRFEPTEGTLVTMTINGPRHEVINPLQPTDISAVGWIRVNIVSNSNAGLCALFGMLQ